MKSHHTENITYIYINSYIHICNANTECYFTLSVVFLFPKVNWKVIGIHFLNPQSTLLLNDKTLLLLRQLNRESSPFPNHQVGLTAAENTINRRIGLMDLCTYWCINQKVDSRARLIDRSISSCALLADQPPKSFFVYRPLFYCFAIEFDLEYLGVLYI